MSNGLKRSRSVSPLVSGSTRAIPVSRRVGRALATRQVQTLLQVAGVQSREYVQVEKLRAVDHLAREAATGHAMLTQLTNTLAQGDPMVADELKFFTDIARLGKGEIIADTIDSFTRGIGQ